MSARADGRPPANELGRVAWAPDYGAARKRDRRAVWSAIAWTAAALAAWCIERATRP